MSISSSHKHPFPTSMDILFNLNLLADQAQCVDKLSTQNTDKDVGDIQAKPSVTTTTSDSEPHTEISCDKPALPGTSSKKRKNNHEHTYLLTPENRPPNPIASTSSETASYKICVSVDKHSTQNTDKDVGDTQAKPSVTTTTSSSEPHTEISCDKPALPGTSSKKQKNNHEHTYLLTPENRPPNPIASASSETVSPKICVMKWEDIPVKEPNKHGFLIDRDATDSELFHLSAFNPIQNLKAKKLLPNYTLCNLKLNAHRYYNKTLPNAYYGNNPTYSIIRDLIAQCISIFPKPNDKNFEYPYPFKISHLPSMNAYQLSFNPDRNIVYKLRSFTTDNTEYIKLCPICVPNFVHICLAYTNILATSIVENQDMFLLQHKSFHNFGKNDLYEMFVATAITLDVARIQQPSPLINRLHIASLNLLTLQPGEIPSSDKIRSLGQFLWSDINQHSKSKLIVCLVHVDALLDDLKTMYMNDFNRFLQEDAAFDEKTVMRKTKKIRMRSVVEHNISLTKSALKTWFQIPPNAAAKTPLFDLAFVRKAKFLEEAKTTCSPPIAFTPTFIITKWILSENNTAIQYNHTEPQVLSYTVLNDKDKIKATIDKYCWTTDKAAVNTKATIFIEIKRHLP